MVGSGKEEEVMVVFPPLLSCESSVCVKEGPDKKNILSNTSGCQLI